MTSAHVKLRVFIPSDTVRYPTLPTFPAFGGDNRGFAFDTGTSRAELAVDVQGPFETPFICDKSYFSQIEISATASFGESTRYRPEDVEHVPGKPKWWARRKLNVRAVDRSTAVLNNSS